VTAAHGIRKQLAAERDRDDAALMALGIHSITFDCADARALAAFWAGLLGWNVYYDDDPEVVVAPSFPNPGMGLLFNPGPEGKTAKNRVHLDLRAAPGLDGDERMAALEAECERLVALGATRVERPEPAPPMTAGHIVMTDPEGNEFCLD
jgi:catechol 2,3-dioxygenase-like lactoylglutathione lyase family enzyme